MITAIVVVAVVLGLAVLPHVWIRQVMARHSAERADIEATGGQLARNLLDRLGLHGVTVEQTDLGDHYDPEKKAVRLSPGNFAARSLAANVIAAHEVGHAMQDATGYTPLAARQRLARQAHYVEKLSVVLMLAGPIIMLVSKSPVVLVLTIGAAALITFFTVLVHAFTLPVEFDASFARAMPVLEAASVLKPEDMPAARQLLRAAALTYVAAAAMTLLDVARWFRILRA